MTVAMLACDRDRYLRTHVCHASSCKACKVALEAGVCARVVMKSTTSGSSSSTRARQTGCLRWPPGWRQASQSITRERCAFDASSSSPPRSWQVSASRPPARVSRLPAIPPRRPPPIPPASSRRPTRPSSSRPRRSLARSGSPPTSSPRTPSRFPLPRRRTTSPPRCVLPRTPRSTVRRLWEALMSHANSCC